MRWRRIPEGRGVGGGPSAAACSEIRPLLSLMVDHEANDLQRAKAARHLTGCTACRSFLGITERTSGILRAEGAGADAVAWDVGTRNRRDTSSRDRDREMAAKLAVVMREGSTGNAQPVSRRPAFAAAVVAAALSAGMIIGGLGVWTLTQDPVADDAGYRLGSPRIVAARTLDPGTDVEERVSILASWTPRRLADDPYWEKWMMGITPMSLFDQVHYRPENL